jgi:sugar lactone lactonase YvrE
VNIRNASRVFAILAVLLLACSLPCLSQIDRAPTPDVILGTGTITTDRRQWEYAAYTGDGGKATAASLLIPLKAWPFTRATCTSPTTHNNVIREVNSTGIISTYAGDQFPWGHLQRRWRPRDIGWPRPSQQASSLTVLVTSTSPTRPTISVRKVDTTGKITTYAGTGAPGSSGDGGLATKAELNLPDGLAIDAANNLYITDDKNNVVREIVAKTGIVNTIAGTGIAGYSGDGGQAVNAELNVPVGIFFNPSNKSLYIADYANNRVREVDASGVISTFAGTGNQSPSATACSSGLATAANLAPVYDIQFDNSGNAYFTMYQYPNGISEVCKVDTGGNISLIAGLSSSGYGGDGGPADMAQLQYPSYVAFDAPGNLYIADTFNQRIRKVTYEPVTASPVLSEKSGTYPGTISVTVTDATTGAIIYCTDDGTTPTTSSPQYGGAIQVAENTTLQCFAQAPGDTASAIAKAIYTIQAALPTFKPGAGTYSVSVSVTISDSTSGATIHYTLDGTMATAASPTYSGPISITKTTVVNAVATATNLAASNDVSASYTIQATLTAKPVLSPAGGTFGEEQFVTITDATAGATIYYTLNGTTPTASSTQYTAPVAIPHTETLKAIATAPNFGPSAVASGPYIVAGTPEVLIAPATAVTASGATMNASVSPFGAAATCTFQYGTSKTALTSTTKSVALAATAATDGINASLTGLKSKTTYYYRAVVTTVGGSSTSAIASFTTN